MLRDGNTAMILMILLTLMACAGLATLVYTAWRISKLHDQARVPAREQFADGGAQAPGSAGGAGGAGSAGGAGTTAYDKAAKAALSSSYDESSTALYYTIFDRRSYKKGSGRVWKNIASAPSTPTRVEAGCSDASRDIEFGTTPVFEDGRGFGMRAVETTGPLSHVLDIDLDQEFAIVLVYSTVPGAAPAPPPAGAQQPVSILQLFANTSNNNALHLRQGASGMTLQIADTNEVTLMSAADEAEAAAAAKGARAGTGMPGKSDIVMLVITRHSESSKLRVVEVDLQSSDYVARHQEMGTFSISDTTRIPLSNRAMMINKGGRWSANLMEVRMERRYLGNREIQIYADRLRNQLNEYDPETVEKRKLERQLDKTRQCPYDDTTCAVCGGIDDWSSEAGGIDSVAISGGKQCLSAINRFCSKNPKHARCSCWDATNAEYDFACKSYRNIFDPNHKDPTCAPPAKPPVDVPPPPPPPPPDKQTKPRCGDDDETCDNDGGGSDSDSDCDKDKDGSCDIPRRPHHKHRHHKRRHHKHRPRNDADKDGGKHHQTSFWDWFVKPMAG